MSNPIAEARADVAAVLATLPGLAVHQFIPEQMEAPAAIIHYAEPYLTPGTALGDYAVGLQVFLFMSGDNQTSTESLDELIVSVCEALRKEFGVSAVSVGIDRESYDVPHLRADITINQIHFKEGI